MEVINHVESFYYALRFQGIIWCNSPSSFYKSTIHCSKEWVHPDYPDLQLMVCPHAIFDLQGQFLPFFFTSDAVGHFIYLSVCRSWSKVVWSIDLQFRIPNVVPYYKNQPTHIMVLSPVFWHLEGAPSWHWFNYYTAVDSIPKKFHNHSLWSLIKEKKKVKRKERVRIIWLGQILVHL